MLTILSSRSTAHPAKQSLIASVLISAHRSYHGDPGPSTSLHVKARKKQVREGVSAKGGEIAYGLLEQLLDGDRRSPSRIKEFSSESRHATRSRPDRLQGREGFPGRQEGLRHGPEGYRGGRDELGGRREGARGSRDGSQGRPGRPFMRRSPGVSFDRPVRAAPVGMDAFATSFKLKSLFDKFSKPPSQYQIGQACNLVRDTAREAVNAPVYNQLLAFLGGESLTGKMWAAYNEMKKRGIRPTSRTYATLLNAYAGISRPDNALPETTTLSRVTIIYDQSQKHIKECATRLAQLKKKEDVGLAGVKEEADEELLKEIEGLEQEVSLIVTNAYLKFLARFSLWEEMQKVFLTMEQSGPLAPTSITYSTMFSALLSIHLKQRTESSASASKVAIGPVARGIWDQAVRRQSSIGSEPTVALLDERVVINAMQCLIRGRPEDQRLVPVLVSHIWSISAPGQTSLTSNPTDLPQHMQNLPKLKLTLRAAHAIISTLRQGQSQSLAAHYSILFLFEPSLLRQIDQPMVEIAIANLAPIGDIATIQRILDSFTPAANGTWSRATWVNALTAARWAGDFPAALGIFRRMTHLPINIETSSSETRGPRAEYKWTSPNGQTKDVRGKDWVKSTPIVPDAGMMGLLLKTAIGNKPREIRQALNVFDYFGVDHWMLVPMIYTKQQIMENNDLKKVMRDSGNSIPLDLKPNFSLLPPFQRCPSLSTLQVKEVVDRLYLAREVEGAAERLLDVARNREEGIALQTLNGTMMDIGVHWEEALDLSIGREGSRRETRESVGAARGAERMAAHA
ncbi:hypothetical protein P7C73_g1775, partial [Tremellales sp. Uapishka_1]